jgi:hypothetical protein
MISPIKFIELVGAAKMSAEIDPQKAIRLIVQEVERQRLELQALTERVGKR